MGEFTLICNCAAWVLSFAQSQLETDLGDAIKKKAEETKNQQALETALREYTEGVRERYGNNSEEWDRISGCLFRCLPQSQEALFSDIRETKASRKKLLARWEERNIERNKWRSFQSDERQFFIGFIGILFDVIPPPDSIRIEGLQEGQECIQIDVNKLLSGQEELMELARKMLAEWPSRNPAPAPAPAVERVKDCAGEYRNRWTKPLFLNNPRFSDDVRKVCLHQVHVPHRYRFGTSNNPANEEKRPLLERFKQPGGFLVLGDPGIGKSTLITRYLNESNDTREMRVYRLTDFELTDDVEKPAANLLERMELEWEHLHHCILFLDGLDECGLSPAGRGRFLTELRNNWDFPEEKRVSWVVTCRRHYISDRDEDLLALNIPFLRLLPMESGEINRFLEKFEAARKKPIAREKRNALLSKKYSGEYGNLFGIPLILYMTVAMDKIQVTENSSLVSVYDQLFCTLHIRARDEDGHRLVDLVEWSEIQKMNRYIAQWMLFHPNEGASIPETEYRKIEDVCGGQIKELKLHKIGSYMRHTEGKQNLCFIHRTMYEYFVADGFVALAKEGKNAEELSGLIAWYWHKEKMSPTIQEYVKEKLTLEENQTLCSLSLWEDAGSLLMTRGVKGCPKPSAAAVPGCPFPYYPGTLTEDRRQENTAFYSLCRLLNGVREAAEEARLIYQDAPEETRDALARAVRHCGADRSNVYCPNFDLSGADLSRADLDGAYLDSAHLDGAHLDGANLDGAYLDGAHLSRARLTRAHLSLAHLSRAHLDGAHLSRAHLSRAYLSRAHLSRAVLSRADLTGAHLGGAYLLDATLNSTLLTEEQVQYLGKIRLSNCIFESILIANSDGNIISYSRSDFFSTFFPKEP